MSVTTSVHTSVAVSVAARSTVWAANEIARFFMEIVQHQQLPMDYMHTELDVILKGLRTWMTGHHLEAAVLEIYNPRTNKVVQRYDFDIDYRSHDPDAAERFETFVDDVKNQLPSKPLPKGCKYRVIASNKDGAPDLPGWSSTTFRDISHLTRNALGKAIDTARVGVNLIMYSSKDG